MNKEKLISRIKILTDVTTILTTYRDKCRGKYFIVGVLLQRIYDVMHV